MTVELSFIVGVFGVGVWFGVYATGLFYQLKEYKNGKNRCC